MLIDTGLSKRAGGWENLGPRVPARFLPAVGSERFASEANVATAPSVFWVRWCPELADLSPADELSDCDVTYAIKAVTWDGRKNSDIEIAAVRKYAK